MESTEKWMEGIYEKLEQKLYAECTRMGNKIPYWTINGIYQEDYAEKDIYWWTNGFWSGILWQLYHATGKELYLQTARKNEELLDKALHGFTGLHHDTGFMWLHSAVADYRLTGSEAARIRGLTAASVLAGRYNPNGKFIRAWNPDCVEEGEDCTGWIIVDSMMNIPLLYWASQITGDPRFHQIAVNHANTVASYLVREDGSCGHIACINPDTGELEQILAGQGYSDTSSWSRGQSWILYGFALSYRYTGDKKYLDIAKKTAHYFVANVSQTDYIPLCDFRQPASSPYLDTSAGLCAACGLLEIAEHIDGADKALYQTHAMRIVKSICEKSCIWDPAADGIVQNCKVAFHNDRREQTDLIYADYFLTEAVLRMTGKDFLIW
ncbi:MAG: glycoside hydrolase family 88 protein [Lachnospiraceae bacterium]|jgi:unsaturated chondroitin disaccharide hydrolase